jgi:hypothetical protein
LWQSPVDTLRHAWRAIRGQRTWRGRDEIDEMDAEAFSRYLTSVGVDARVVDDPPRS